jgi:diketogulonate reductase-like aldo/keto reductase
MRMVALPSGETVPALGMGTWHIGESAAARSDEVRALQQGLDLGLRLIDTAEMYAEGGSEEVIGRALSDRPSRRDAAFVVSKVYPHNASRQGTIAACERSLRRLQTDRIDLYLLHWRGQYPLAETVEAFESLKRAGKIRHWGVSNLDASDMAELWAVPGGQQVTANQVLYNLGRRGIEWDLLPWHRARGLPTMAYSPIEQGELAAHTALQALASRHDLSAAQLAVAWLLQQGDVLAIPKTVSVQRLQAFAQVADLVLDSAQLAELDALFAPPAGPSALEML